VSTACGHSCDYWSHRQNGGWRSDLSYVIDDDVVRWTDNSSRRSLWWWAAGLAFVLAISAILVFAASLHGEDLDRADKLASIGSLVTGIAGLLLGGLALWVAVRHDARKAAVGAAEEMILLDRATSRLADAVRRQWTQEAELRQLRRPRPLRVRWSTTVRPVSAQPTVVLGEGVVPGRPTRLKLRGDLYGVIETFRRLPARQLVVIGEPGAGKTVLAMLFTLDLLETRVPNDPVAVLLPLSSWNPRTEHPHSWLARRLIEDYPALANTDAYGPKAATQLIDAGRLIPVLDGLDEMPPALHGAAIDALDRAVADGGPLVVTCRSNEYQSAVTTSGKFLSRAAVVEIEPVDVTGSIEFLTAARTAGDTRWRPVFDHLQDHPNGPLAQALSTPLMVYLTRTAYADPNTNPAELCDPNRFADPGAIQGHLLDAYLPSLYSDYPPPSQSTPDGSLVAVLRAYPSDQAQRWLTFIARHLHQQQTRDLAWWQLHNALPSRVKKWAGAFGLAFTEGLVCAMAVGIAAGRVGFAAGFTGAFTAGFFNALRKGPPSHPRQLTVQLRGRQKQIRQQLIVGITTGLGVGISLGVTIGIATGITIGVTVGIIVGITSVMAVGVLMGLTQWLKAPAEAIRSPSPISVLRSDRTVTGMQTLLGIFGCGFAVGLTVTAMGEITVGVAGGIAIGLVGGLVAGLLPRPKGRFAAETRRRTYFQRLELVASQPMVVGAGAQITLATDDFSQRRPPARCAPPDRRGLPVSPRPAARSSHDTNAVQR
jgi:NACHT domain